MIGKENLKLSPAVSIINNYEIVITILFINLKFDYAFQLMQFPFQVHRSFVFESLTFLAPNY